MCVIMASENIGHVGEHEVERLAVSANGGELASLRYYQGKT